MNDSFPLFDIIFFAAIAAFLIFRLRSVLGRRTGHEKQPPTDIFSRDKKKKDDEAQDDDDKVVHLPGLKAQDPDVIEGDFVNEDDLQQGLGDEISGDAAVIEGLTQIRRSDKNFSPEDFLKGSSAAFEIIVEAFADDDEKTLRPLLSDDVFANFKTVIDERKEAGETLETNLVGLKKVEILEADTEGKMASITVKFVSEQINLTRDKEGEIIDGNPDYISEVTDIWTFSRNIRSRDPNWTLSETRSQN